MADLRTSFAGITSPNPFWLASAPPTDKEYNVRRAYEAGWGGVVWKTLGEDPPVVNLSSRYGALQFEGKRLMGLNNIELISDRPLATNIAEIKRVKRDFPDRALIVSLMVPCEEHRWKAILPLIEETGADGIELNFGCPHGMSERNMGSAVGQVPEYVEMVTRWCKQNTRMPVIVKLTPNVTNILMPARAARRGGADAVSLINTIQSVIGVDLDAMAPMPVVGGKGTHGGYCGPAVKPIALRMIGEIARDPEMAGIPISGMGGISNWRDSAEFLAMGSSALQVCTAAMHYGFRIVEDMIDGLSNWMDSKDYATLPDLSGRAVSRFVPWNQLNMKFRTIAQIDQESCVGCGLCHIACEDTSHQAIAKSTGANRREYSVIEDECVGCNLCAHVCPVDDCITMTPQPVDGEMTWLDHPSNPHRLSA
ncbi:NAD-dependent dihydropyrimidine dehydrogenase subunit PreA [Asaia bogorensis]|uniref:dihydrouracil dehydrogenase (NAD(+)) n=1 Tax=Asaia bogorensis NBRC 16594 TaxID=1231624 RepID=A0AAN4R1Z8_9PROT|nr:NAD-dependent dihydropyrimidine dehydrogenase subunit PreA [Asaia bogorensis]BAT18422.1 dihydropyrimidine dehydrogenase [Asaia bogorensis NBRC 16594]GBQ74725.1 dihydropyrimidine dehydrogenase [Asaia bogorensis NBRC 16594]GEL52772.1 dihydropyrimidine dehydrogenase subunit B [Asaia bogorensis NBRC 16594]